MAVSDPDGSLDPIEAEVERDRADLLGTVEALRRRISADSIRSGVDGYAGRMREGMTARLTQSVRDHPLETVAIGAGVAYPILRVASKIPAPILLLGAGVALAGRGRGRPAEEVEVALVEEEVAVAMPASASGGGRAAPTGPRVSTPLGGTGSTGAAPVGAAPDRRAEPDAGGRAGAVGERLASAGRSGQEELIEAIQRHPAAAAGLGLLVGGALAAMLPRSRVEDSLYGEAAEEARARARALALEGIDAGREVLQAAHEEADDQGLTLRDARGVAEEAGRRARDAARDATRDSGDAASKRSD